VKFGEFATKPVGSEKPEDADGMEPVDADLTILSGEPVNHPYWGKCMFDVAGAQTHKDTYPLDYCHDPQQIVGKFDRPTAGEAGQYTAKASVIPFAPGDRANEIIHRQAAGTPYEASIFFDPGTCKAEYLDQGEVGQCNGRQVEGPLTIFRQFDLRGCALCPAGADKFAHADFCAGECSIPVSGNFFPPQKVQDMSASSAAAAAAPVTPPTSAGEASAAPAVTVETKSPEQLRAAEASQFTATFGAVDGAAYFAAGETIASASAKHAAKLTQENADLKRRLEAAGLAGAFAAPAGEVKPVSADDPAAKPAAPEVQRFGKNVGAFMAACKPPAK
jgi:hypothetical protein